MRHWLFLLPLALAVAASGRDAAAQNTLRWASQADAPSADPHAPIAPSAGEAKAQVYHPLAGQIYEPLVRRNAKAELEPALAVAWKWVDATTWDFRLRPGVRFHDGTAFGVDDVIFSLERANARGSGVSLHLAGVAAVTKVDDQTIRVATRAPDPVLPGRLTEVGIMSKAWAERHGVQMPPGMRQETFALRNANGTGPFMLKKREPGVETVLERSPAWWGWRTPQGQGNLDRIVFKPIRAPAARLAALQSGDVDLVVDLPRRDMATVRQNPKLKVLQTAQIRSIFLGFDVARSRLRTADVGGKNPFADKRVRQAIQLAIDPHGLNRVVMGGFSLPAGVIIPPGVRGYAAALDKPVKFNPDAARRLLTQAGYPNGFAAKLDCPNDRYLNDEQICLAAAGTLGRIGIKVSVDAQSQTLHFAKIRGRQSDFFLLGWGVPTYDSQYVFEYLYATKGIWNATGYSSPRMDGLVRKIGGEMDAKKRDALIAEAWALAKADVIYVPIHHQIVTWAMSKALDLPITAEEAPNFRWAKMARVPAARAR